LTQTKKKVDTVIKIHDYLLETEDTIYEVTPKYDADAPDGYRNSKSTKILSDTTGRNTISVAFNREMGLWDTGLYESSPMYRDMNPTDRKTLVSKVEELIVEPFENIYGKNKLDPRDKDSEFWNYLDDTSFKVDLYQGKLFHTTKPLELLKLFICLANKDLAPKKGESAPQYRTAQFCIENKEEVRNSKVEDEVTEMEVIGKFYSLLEQEKTLNPILRYIGLKNIDVANREFAITMFKRFIDNKQQSYQNRKLFLDAIELNATKNGRKEIIYYAILSELLTKGKLVKVDNEFMVGETPVGNNLKAAAKFISTKPTMQSQVDEMVK